MKDPPVFPGDIADTAGRNEIHTAVLALNLTAGGFAVRAGAFGNGGLPASPGQVLANQGGLDFPAASFFDVFVDVDIPGLGTVTNASPLLPENKNLQDPPGLHPKVIYIHGATNSVTVTFVSVNSNVIGVNNGDTLGTLQLAGHVVNFQNNQQDVNAFNQGFKQAVDSQINDPQERSFLDSQPPEPSTFVLLADGLAFLGWHRRRRAR